MNFDIEITQIPILVTNTEPTNYAITMQGQGSREECNCLSDYLTKPKVPKKLEVNYKKLLKICMETWVDAEGDCWNGSNGVGKKLSKKEYKIVKAIYDKLM